MKNKKDDFQDPVGQPFVLPKAMLSQIGECSPQGFILFYVDQNGLPDVKANFNIPAIEMGLRSFACKFLKGINMVEELGIAESIYEQSIKDQEEDSD